MASPVGPPEKVGRVSSTRQSEKNARRTAKGRGRRLPFLRRWLYRLIAVSLATLLAVLVGEIGLRLAGVSYPTFARVDALRGVAHIPGAEGLYMEEGRAWVRINSDGMRDVEHAVEKPPDTLRIAVLGDSYAEALQVPLERAFFRVLQAELHDCESVPRRRVEVLNFGVSGYGTAQELLTFRHQARKYEPDVILLAFLTGNDVSDNSRELKQIDYVPYFTLEGGELVLDDGYLESPVYRRGKSAVWRFLTVCINHSRVLQLMNQARYRWRVWSQRNARGAHTSAPFAADGVARGRHPPGTPRNPGNVDAAPWSTAGDPAAGEPVELGLSSVVYAEPEDATWRDAWAVTEALLARLHTEVSAAGMRLCVVTLSNAVQVHPDRELRRRVTEALGVPDLFYPDRRVREAGERLGFEVLNLAPTMQERASREGVFFHGFGETLGAGHWNERGHRVAGELVARWLCSRL